MSNGFDREFIQAAIQDYYWHETTGGFLHIVLDDYNVSDDHIRWCLDDAERPPCYEGHAWCHAQAEMIGEMLLMVPEGYRESLIRKAHETAGV